jgi:hypothetical protein
MEQDLLEQERCPFLSLLVIVIDLTYEGKRRTSNSEPIDVLIVTRFIAMFPSLCYVCKRKDRGYRG